VDLFQGVSTTRGVRVMVFKATFKNISVILWLSGLLVEETGKIQLMKQLSHFIRVELIRGTMYSRYLPSHH
jgi:hypothetical protein